MKAACSLIFTLVCSSLATFQLTASTVLYDLSKVVISGDDTNTWAASISSANSGGTAGTFSSSPSNLTYSWKNSSTSATQNTYFICKFSESVSLVNIGDKITLNFTVTATNINSGIQAFRFGLFSLGNVNAGSGYASAVGYRVDYGSSNNANNGIRYRQNETSANVNLYASATSPLINDDTQTNSNYTWSALVSTSGYLEIELLANNQIKITTSFGGSTQSSVTTSILNTTFDALSFFTVAPKDTSGSLSFSELSVAYTAIPEPAAVAVILPGLAGLGAFVLRRRASPGI